MKIAILGIRGIPANYGGFETCAEHVSKWWTENGNEVLVFCRKSHYKDKLENYNGCKIIYTSSIKTKSLDTVTHTLFSFLNLIFKNREFKNVHLYNTGNAIFIPLLKIFGKKVVISVDGIEWKREKWGKAAKLMHKIGERVAVKFADYVVADNIAVKDYYLDRYGKKTETIPYGAKLISNDLKQNEDIILNKYSLSTKKYFIFVGRLVPEKGVHNLIEAYKKLKTDYKLVIIGDDKEGEYRDNLFLNNSNRINFLGYVYGEEYEILLKNAYLYVSASELEGTSPSLLAAMGAKVCALINGIEENKFTVKNNAFLYKCNDLSNLIEIWQELNDNTEITDKMGENGYSFVQKEYDWENIANRYLELFNPIGKSQELPIMEDYNVGKGGDVNGNRID